MWYKLPKGEEIIVLFVSESKGPFNPSPPVQIYIIFTEVSQLIPQVEREV